MIEAVTFTRRFDDPLLVWALDALKRSDIPYWTHPQEGGSVVLCFPEEVEVEAPQETAAEKRPALPPIIARCAVCDEGFERTPKGSGLYCSAPCAEEGHRQNVARRRRMRRFSRGG